MNFPKMKKYLVIKKYIYIFVDVHLVQLNSVIFLIF